MTRRQTLTAALSPLFAPLLAWLPGRAVEPVPQWTGFVGDDLTLGPFSPRMSSLEGWTFENYLDGDKLPKPISTRPA